MNRTRSGILIAIYVFLVASLMTSYPATADDGDKTICRADFVFTVGIGSDEATIRKYIMQNKIVRRFGCKFVAYADTLFTENKILTIGSQIPISLTCAVANDALFKEMNNIFLELTEGATADKKNVDPDGLAVVSPVSISSTTASCKTCYSVRCATDGTYYCITSPRGDACKVANRCQ